MISLRIRLSAVILGVLVVALLLLSMQTARKAEGLLQPEIERKAATVADTVAALVGRALELGIPFERLRGLDDYLQRIVDANPDVIVLVDAAWNSAEQKRALLADNPITKELDAVVNKRYLVIPFPASEAGVRNVPATADMATQLARLTFGE